MKLVKCIYLSVLITRVFLSLPFLLSLSQAFINTAKEIYEKIQEGVFDINNEVRHTVPSLYPSFPTLSLSSLFFCFFLSSSLCSPLLLSFLLLGVVFQQRVGFAMLPPLLLKERVGGDERGGKNPSSLASFHSSQAKLARVPPFSCSIFHSLSLHSSALSLSLSLGNLPAHKFLTSHKVSVIRQENKHSSSQPARQSVSL